jgi:hypothetical protein
MPYVYPSPPDVETCVLLFVPVELVPIVGALFSQLEKRSRWVDDANHLLGYTAFVELQKQLMSNCLADLIAEIRALRGVKPEYESTPIDERTTDMYRDFNDIIGHLLPIIFALRGPEDIPDSLIQALRGDTPADSTRNVVDQLI